MDASATVLDAIGNTALVQLRRVVPAGCARILVKVEGQNPTGSMKDRMAQAMIARAEQDGRLRPGDTVVEYTGGSTGASLALVCAAKGYRLRIVSSPAFSEEKLAQMAAFGAELTLIQSEGNKITRKLIGDMIEMARKFSRQPRTYWTDQLNNADSIAGYHPMGEEIWRQSGGKVDAFVQAIGTTASLCGVAGVLRRHNPRVRGVEIVRVPPAAAAAMARRLAREEGLFAGTSSGANVVAAIEIGRRLGPEAGVATLLVDSGLKYLSTEVYRRAM
jgi:cysteine synthase A